MTESVSPFAKRLGRLGTENAFKVGEDIKRVEDAGKDVVKLNLGEPDYDSAENINRVANEQINAGNSHYTDPQGVLPLRESIAKDLAKSRRVEVDPARIVVTSGGKPPISYSMMSYVDPGDEVIYPNPGFPIYESWVKFMNAVPRPLNLVEQKGFSFDLSDVEALVNRKTKLVIINSPSNPTGGVISKDDLAGLARLLLDKAHPQFRVLSDEVYDHILFDGHRHHSILCEPGMAEHTILLNSLSKTYAMTGWRIGYAVLPTKAEAMCFKQLNINIYSCTPPFIQMAAKQAIDDVENQRIAAGMTRQFQERRDVVIKALNQIRGFSCINPLGAFYAFPNISQACSELGIMEYCQSQAGNPKAPMPSTIFQMFALYEHGVATLDRAAFGGVDCQGQHYLRISLASDIGTLEKGVERLDAAVNDQSGIQSFMNQKLPGLFGYGQ
jgi:aspartate aminotransferase